MRTLLLAVTLALVSGCTVIHQGEVGVLRRWGKIDDKPVGPGLIGYEPISTQVALVPIRTTTVTSELTLPSKEGLNIDARISILYRIDPDAAPRILGTIGPNYEDELIVAVFRSAAADVTARFFARDMYSTERAHIEREVKRVMGEILTPRGFIIESVLMKSIALPPGLARAIETKLQAEQDAERMNFLVQRERLEADRKRIEAEGDRDAQKILADGLTDGVLRLRALEAFKALANSPNTKIVITDSRSPLQQPIELDASALPNVSAPVESPKVTPRPLK